MENTTLDYHLCIPWGAAMGNVYIIYLSLNWEETSLAMNIIILLDGAWSLEILVKISTKDKKTKLIFAIGIRMTLKFFYEKSFP